ncbi:hypothetical protein Ciccas_001780 [Cichlidogyrus casuarinus]|uniref:HMG box domain-containing protein n=1 Tax=Cichlidogyrus casuarinus TaxID=1844966 RepID=A0ABD2QJ28_9PLAT
MKELQAKDLNISSKDAFRRIASMYKALDSSEIEKLKATRIDALSQKADPEATKNSLLLRRKKRRVAEKHGFPLRQSFSGFSTFVQQRSKSNPMKGRPITEVAKVLTSLSNEWKGLNEREKSQYNTMAKVNKEKYLQKIKDWAISKKLDPAKSAIYLINRFYTEIKSNLNKKKPSAIPKSKKARSVGKRSYKKH